MNVVGLLFLLALGAAAYVAWVWVPIVFEHQNVERVVREHANLAVKNRDDAALVRKMTDAIGKVAYSEEIGDDGRLLRRPAIDVRPQDVVWERDGETLHVAFGYVRRVVYPYVNWQQDRYFTVDLTADVSLPRWDHGK